MLRHNKPGGKRVKPTILILTLLAAAPAAATVMIAAPSRQPSACFDPAATCAATPLPPVPAEPPAPQPLVAVMVGIAALGFAFGRRGPALQEVVS